MKKLIFLMLSLFIGMYGFAKDPLKVGFVYVGPISDHGWSYQHDQGRLAIEKQFGKKVETTYVESVSEGADSERVIRQLAANGHDLIFTTSFGYMNPTLKVAKKFSKVNFEHATGYKTSRNMSAYNAKYYEGRYVVGLIAGKMTKSNVIGYIASFPIPEVIRGINSFTLGLKKSNPNATVKVIWVSTWYDPGKEADAAKALIDQKADVILQHTDSPAPAQVAEQRGVYAIGQASDMQSFAPKAILTSIVNNWASYYVNRVQATLDGTWKSENYWGGLKENSINIASYNPIVPPAVQKLANEAISDIVSGKVHPFTGPFNKQNGEVWAKTGETLDDGTLLGMNEYVEGVVGKLPK